MWLYIILALLLLVIYYNIKISKYAHLEQQFKGPKPLPILGNILDFGTNCKAVFASQIKLFDKYGATWKYFIGSQLCIMTCDPEFVKQTLGNTKMRLELSHTYDFFKDWLGDGLPISRGEYHQNSRKLIQPAFRSDIMKESSFHINKHAKVLHRKLMIDGGGGINVKPLVASCVVDIMSGMILDTALNAQTNSDLQYVKSTEEILRLCLNRNFSIIGHFDSLYKLTSSWKLLSKHIQYTQDFVHEIVEKKKLEREDVKYKEIPRKSVLDLLMNLKGDLTDKEIEDHVQSFAFAGFDTAASIIAFSLYELAKHPDVQARLIDESNKVLGDDQDTEIPYDVAHDLTYLRCVTKECQRMYATTPFLERELLEDALIDGVQIPRGTLIHIHLYMLHRNAKHYANPNEFRPERFTDENVQEMHPCAFIPFGTGLRTCIGYRLGITVLRSIVLGIIRKFELSPVEGFEPQLTNIGILSSENGLYINFKPR